MTTPDGDGSGSEAIVIWPLGGLLEQRDGLGGPARRLGAGCRVQTGPDGVGHNLMRGMGLAAGRGQ